MKQYKSGQGILFPEGQLSCFSQRKLSLTLFKALPLHLLFFLESLVFICREHSRVSKILLFPDCPRFCWLMKTRNRRYLRASGMDGVKSGESGAFIFSRRVPDFCDGRDHSWQMKTHICTVRDVGDGFRSLPIPITNKHGVSRKHEWLLSRISCPRGKEEWYGVFSWLLPFQNRNSCIDERKNADVLRTTQHKLVCIHVAVQMQVHLCSRFNFWRTFHFPPNL